MYKWHFKTNRAKVDGRPWWQTIPDPENETQIRIKESSSLPKENLHLLELPLLVNANILKYLDASSLRLLRTVSRATKSWIDQDHPQCLRKLKIYLKDENQLEQMIKSKVPWNNVSIHWKLCRLPTLPTLLTQLRPSLKILKIASTEPGSLVSPRIATLHLCNILRSLGPQLESFKLSVGIYNKRNLNDDDAVENWKTHFKMTIENHLVGLKHLHFRKMQSSRSKEIVHSLVAAFLDISPNLVSITLPIVKDEMMTIDEQISLEQCEPIISYLNEQSKRRRPTLKALAFNYEHIYNHSEPRPVFRLISSTLVQLVKLCAPIGTKLYNVPSNLLPSSSSPISSHESNCLAQCIASVHCRNSTRGLENINIFKNDSGFSSIKSAISISPQALQMGYNLPDSTMNIWCIYMDCGNLSADTVLNHFLKNVRPTVTKLAFVLNVSDERILFKLPTVFPNLKKLYLAKACFNESCRDREIKTFLDRFEHLEEIVLARCYLGQEQKDVHDFERGKYPYHSKREIRRRTINCKLLETGKARKKPMELHTATSKSYTAT